jgi:RNA:NAD 2'-phosphotransferase (TPT1/KptA family)
MEKDLEQLSRFLSFILRHKPESIGIALDEHGWANVEELLAGINEQHFIDMIFALLLCTVTKQFISAILQTRAQLFKLSESPFIAFSKFVAILL